MILMVHVWCTFRRFGAVRMARRPPVTALTQRSVDSAGYPVDAVSRPAHFVPDGSIPRLFLQVLPSGEKRFVVRVCRGGQRIERIIGHHPETTLVRARILAVAALERFDRGEDPPIAELVVADAGFTVTQRVPTLREFFETYWTDHAQHLRSGKEIRRLAERHLLKKLGGYKLDAITRPLCAAIMNAMRDTPYEANRVREQLTAIIHKACEWEYLPANHPSPMRFVKPYPEEPRSRVLTDSELLALYKAVDIIDAAHTRVFFRMLMDVPLRKSELLRAKWIEYDADRGTLRVTSSSRNKRTGTQPLTPEIAGMLNELPRLDDNPFIFSGREGTGHLKDIDSQWKRIKAHAGVKDARLHDLRRTIATEFAGEGANEFELQRMLGHTTTVASKHYVHLAANPRHRDFANARSERRQARMAQAEALA
jgi:integrase